MLGVADHGHLPGNPGWLLRNALLLAAASFGVAELNAACIRLRRGRPSPQHSMMLSVLLPDSLTGGLLFSAMSLKRCCHILAYTFLQRRRLNKPAWKANHFTAMSRLSVLYAQSSPILLQKRGAASRQCRQAGS